MLLEPFRDKLPPEVFGEPYLPPVTDASGQDRQWLRRGAQPQWLHVVRRGVMTPD